MTFIDLFAGIGGFRLGMEMAGHACLGHCEIDKYANASYQAMHSQREDEWFAEDIAAVRASDLPVCDCWCFGFPCQDISVAGKQAGFTGKRSSLFFAVTRLVRDLEEKDRPKYLLIENVKNLLSVNGGFDFARLLIELDEIGYDAEWDVLNSKNFGVPQNRERVFLVGHLRGRGTREVFPLGETDSFRSGPMEAKTADHEGSSCAVCLTAGANKSWTGNFVRQIGNCMPTTKSRYEQNNFVAESGLIHGRGFETRNDGISHCLKGAEGGYSKNMVKICPVLTPDRAEKRRNGRRIKEDGEPMFTLTSQDRHGLLLERETSARIRRLTPRECFRLQGFPDEYFDRAAAVCSDTQLYRQAGNSVTVPVVYEIAKRMA